MYSAGSAAKGICVGRLVGFRRSGRVALGVALIAAGLVAGCGSDNPTTEANERISVPDVIGLNLKTAKTRLEPDLKVDSRDAAGRNRAQIIDSNWHVIEQSPAPRSAVPKGATVALDVLKEGETASPSASRTATTMPSSRPSIIPSGSATTRPPTRAPASQPQASPPAVTPRTALPAPTNNQSPTTKEPPAGIYYANCTDAKAAGAAPLHAGEPGYRSGLDHDGDGIACE